MEIGELKWDAAGLVTVVVQDSLDGEIRMLAHADEAALKRTIETGLACFHSRSRGGPWLKGETSGHTMAVREIWLDCDRDAVIYLVDPKGPSCHTGAPSCFFSRVWPAEADEGDRARTLLPRLEATLEARRSSTTERSYTKKLLDGGAELIGAKLREEADELARALESESDERVASEAADLLYHAMVGLVSRGLSLRDVEAKLAARLGISGHEEKASRSGS